MITRTQLIAGIIAIAGSGFLPAAIQAQEVRVNEKGEKIIVYPDGSWQYFTVFGGSKDVLFDTKDAAKPGEEPDFSTKYPVFRGNVAPGNLAFTISEEYARRIALRKAQIATEAKSVAEQRSTEATAQRARLEQEMDLMVKQKADEEELQRLTFRLNSARKTENEARLEALQAEQTVAAAEVLTQKGAYLKQVRAAQRQEAKAQRSASSVATLQLADFIAGLALADNPLLLPEEAINNLRSAPAPNCMLVYEGLDPDTRQFRRDVRKQLLFSYTDERLRLFLKDKEYLRCEGFATSIGGFRFLTLQFTFAYPNAREAYGFIEKGSILTIKLLDGSFANLRAGKMDKGSYDTRTGLLTYSVHYPIDRNQIQLLRNSETDSVLVFWSSGYEEYEVFEIDFFINQLSCLEK